MEERATKILSREGEADELLRYYAEHMPGAWVAIYQFLLNDLMSSDTTLLRCCVICAIRQCQIELEKRNKATSTRTYNGLRDR